MCIRDSNNVFLVTIDKNAAMNFQPQQNMFAGFIYAPYMTFEASSEGGGKPEPRVLDLCAGTGCLGIGIRHFVPSASVTCVDKSPQALQYLQANVHGTLSLIHI